MDKDKKPLKWPKEKRLADKQGKSTKLLLQEAIDNSPLRQRAIAHAGTFELMLNHPPFNQWVTKIKKTFGIPPVGFNQKTNTLKNWYKNLDKEAWDKELASIYEIYPKVNSVLLAEIETYLKFNRYNKTPIQSYELFYSQRVRDKHSEITIRIYFPLTDQEWAKIKEGVDRYFNILDSPISKKITFSKIRQLALKDKRVVVGPTQYSTTGEATELMLVNDNYPGMSGTKRKNG